MTSWYPGLPRNWVTEISPNGWMSNKPGLKWLKHSETYTKAHTVAVYRLLIVDGHDSHNIRRFHENCEEQKIIVLCIPPHSSHLLQSLGVGCFPPLAAGL
jgi:hypothetical protein